ncbi:DinB family protein [Paenibacillus sp. GCM10012307]|uniref:DinB family protein n=1 Tax=Paenibacillus roseus TaxID=2798579 RepID=A0A934MTY9_9BACL|nr:DinB family protein [Paenibacillus roseus]MBJ6360552.1 DinB family protein [Paenibacillus roseus]
MSKIPFDIQPYLNIHDQLHQAVEELTQQQLYWKEAPEKWSVVEVISHLADHHIVVTFRIRDLLADTSARLPGFEQDKWVSGQYANESKVEDYLALIAALIQYNSLLLARLRPEDWDKTALNAAGNEVSLRGIITSVANHVQSHLQQIDRIKSAYETSVSG